jgi:hypothetical protein
VQEKKRRARTYYLGVIRKMLLENLRDLGRGRHDDTLGHIYSKLAHQSSTLDRTSTRNPVINWQLPDLQKNRQEKRREKTKKKKICT